MRMPIISFLFLLIFAGSFWLLVQMHEEAHVAIYENYGINASIKYWKGILPYETHADKPCPSEICESDHGLNEVIGYQLQPFLIVIGSGLLFIIFFLELKEIQEDKK